MTITPHDHHHRHIDAPTGDRRVVWAIAVNMLLTVAQIVGGVLSGSLALFADSIHNFSDGVSLIIAFFARRIARRPMDERKNAYHAHVVIREGAEGGAITAEIKTRLAADFDLTHVTLEIETARTGCADRATCAP